MSFVICEYLAGANAYLHLYPSYLLILTPPHEIRSALQAKWVSHCADKEKRPGTCPRSHLVSGTPRIQTLAVWLQKVHSQPSVLRHHPSSWGHCAHRQESQNKRGNRNRRWTEELQIPNNMKARPRQSLSAYIITKCNLKRKTGLPKKITY